MYDLIANRFFNKLNTMYSNDNLLSKIKDVETKTVTKKSKATSSTNESILLTPYEPIKFEATKLWRHCPNPRLFPSKRSLILDQLVLNNATNCKTGQFHIWKSDKGIIKCSVCNINFDEIDLSKQISELIQQNYNKIVLDKRYNQYCKVHECKSNNITRENFHNELVSIYLKRYKSLFMIPEKKEKISDINAITEIQSFLKLIESVIGNDVNINQSNIYLRRDMYVINHDHLGNPIDKPIVFDKIIKKDTHAFFKRAVVQYNRTNLEMFYDADTLLYIGYKDKNNEYHNIPPKVYLHINYSIENRLKMFGYSNKYLDISQKKQSLEEIFDDKQYVLKQIVADIIRNNIENLKRSVNDIRRYINIVANKFDIQKVFSEDESNNDDFVKKYINRLDIKDSNIFQKFNPDNYIYDDITKTINIKYSDKYVEYDEIARYNDSGNNIIAIIAENLTKFINENHKNAAIVYFILDVIINVFDKYNNDALISSQMKRFEYVLNTTGLNEVSAEVIGETEGFYGEYRDENDMESKETRKQKNDDREEHEALDIDTMMDEEDAELRNEFDEGAGLDYEIDYLSGVNVG